MKLTFAGHWDADSLTYMWNSTQGLLVGLLCDICGLSGLPNEFWKLHTPEICCQARLCTFRKDRSWCFTHEEVKRLVAAYVPKGCRRLTPLVSKRIKAAAVNPHPNPPQTMLTSIPSGNQVSTSCL